MQIVTEGEKTEEDIFEVLKKKFYWKENKYKSWKKWRKIFKIKTRTDKEHKEKACE